LDSDGTAATRTDNNNYSYTFAYTALGQLASSTLPNTEGTASYAWGLDGNMTARTWGSSAIAGTYLYDAAKRPVGLYIRLGGSTSYRSVELPVPADSRIRPWYRQGIFTEPLVAVQVHTVWPYGSKRKALTKVASGPMAATTLPWRSGTIQPNAAPAPLASRSPIASMVLYVVPALFAIVVIESLVPR
jgi:hypothetical protein